MGEDWKKVRETATRTELMTSPEVNPDELALLQKPEPSLIVVQGDMMGRVFRLKPGRNIVGRHPESDVVIQQRSVSNLHAEIRNTEDSVICEDLGSRNGTYHNGHKMDRPVVLQAGDLVKVGTAVFKYIDRKGDADFAESLHIKVSTDPMTRAFNKEFVLRALTSSMDVAKTGFPLCIVMIDLDHFKKVNDTHGHLAGDYVLKETCRLLKESVLRGDDVLGRFGGEEFIIVMPDCPLKAAVAVAERVRKTLEGHEFIHEGTRIPVTASLGVSAWKEEFKTPDAFIQAADDLLYESKNQGRNRVSYPANELTKTGA